MNYRKAKKGDIKCSDCADHKEPDWYEKRIRCMVGAQYNGMLGYAVGKNMTCDRARYGTVNND
uniref:Uncharacterized protein n=1 Tax=viral metagenome TaxID=1070528 RepID=A0A6M3JAX2_9ZZZZ